MLRPQLTSRTEQVAQLLRQGMIDGLWRGTLPGRDHLAAELGCSHWTVEQAMQILIREGVLVSQGAGRKRRIELSAIGSSKRVLKFRILLYEKTDRQVDYFVELLHRLQQAGHDARFAEKTLKELKMDVERVARFTQKIDVDAWIVISGSREILEWFSRREAPAFALFGRLNEVALPSASLKKADAGVELIDHLVAFGHRRIVVIAHTERRKPHPGFLEKLLLERIAYHGIPTGSYNLPDWEDHPADLRRLLDSLFAHNPPTALILDQPFLFYAAMQYLSLKGLSAPRDLSLACTDYTLEFDWSYPKVTHIAWKPESVLKSVLLWASSISRGKDIHKKSTTKADLVVGGTIGPAAQ